MTTTAAVPYMTYRDIEAALRARNFMGVRDWTLRVDREKGTVCFASQRMDGRLTLDEARRLAA